jgi:PIN domain nuclease of toxin-antitoxin system
MLAAPQKLGARARSALREVETGRYEAWVPAAVVAELILLRELGRTTIGLPELRRAMTAVPAFRFLPLDLAQLDEFAGLSRFRDPFDRLIVSAARTLRATLVTRDAAIAASGVTDTVWS